MKIAICGSMAFAKDMLKIKRKLEVEGHKVTVPCDTNIVAEGRHDPDDFAADHKHCVEKDIIRRCFKNIELSDAILVVNYEKDGIKGYVGSSTFAEIMFAHHLGKRIFLLFEPAHVSKQRHSHEIGIIQPVIINDDLKMIK